MYKKKRLDFGCGLFGDDDLDFSYGNKYDLSLFFEYLICYKGVTRFYFPNFKRFNRLCWEVITELKVGYPHIKRIWVVKDFSLNLFTDDYPLGYGFLDFDDRQYVKIVNPESSIEETASLTKSIMDLCLFNVFCFNDIDPVRRKKFSYSRFAYNCCKTMKSIKIKYNLYVPKEWRKYQPE